MNDTDLLDELAPVAEQLMDRHIAVCKEWFPHELIPWDRALERDPRDSWVEDDSAFGPDVRSAMLVNLLTEDNLPYYFRDIERMFGRDSVWGEWSRRWTAEEGRHSIVLRDYLTVTGAIDPVELERGRMHQVMSGAVPEPPSASRGFVYLALQELATRIAHHNTGKQIQDPAGYEVMKRVAADENRHFLFYRDLASAALELNPSAMVMNIEAEVKGFAMPGTGIKDFATRAKAIARAGIYNFSIHYDQILVPVVNRTWKLEHLSGLSADAEQARERLVKFMARFKKVAARVADQMAERAASTPATAS